MTKPRKQPSQRRRALLQKEIRSKCPFCPCEAVDTFEVHHINEDPSDDRFENELMVCPTCHSKITAGTITRDEVAGKKDELMKVGNNSPLNNAVQPQPISINGANVAIVGNNNRVTTQATKKQVVKYPPDCIGGNSLKANYVSYLIERYQKFASWRRPDFNIKVFPSLLKRVFKVGSQRTIYNLPLCRFDELVAYIQGRILNTKLGRIMGGSRRLFQTFEEYVAENTNGKL